MKIKSFFALAILLAVTFLSGCSSTSDDLTSESGKQTIYLKLGNVLTKSEDTKLDNTNSVNFNDGYIYFITSQGGIKDYYKIDNSGNTETATLKTKVISLSALKGNGVSFKNISGEVKKVYIVGNPNLDSDEEATMTAPTTLADLQRIVISIKNQGVASDLTIDDLANITAANQTDFPGSVTGDQEAVVSLLPLCSRIQIDKVTGSSKISAYTLKGLYVNKFYDQMPLNSIPTTGVFDLTDFTSAGYASYSTMYDNDGSYDTGTGLGGSTLIKSPADSKVWAYQFFVGNALITPRVVLVLKGVTASEGTYSDPQYLNVRGFLDAAGNAVTLERGHIYEITDLVFKENHLSSVPDPADINLWVKVSVINWTVNTVTPDI